MNNTFRIERYLTYDPQPVEDTLNWYYNKLAGKTLEILGKEIVGRPYNIVTHFTDFTELKDSLTPYIYTVKCYIKDKTHEIEEEGEEELDD